MAKKEKRKNEINLISKFWAILIYKQVIDLRDSFPFPPNVLFLKFKNQHLCVYSENWMEWTISPFSKLKPWEITLQSTKLERSHCICPFSLWNITLKLTYHLYLVLPDWRFYCKRRDSAGGEWSMEPWPGHPTYTHSRPHRSKFLDMLFILLTFRYFRWICFHPCL